MNSLIEDLQIAETPEIEAPPGQLTVWKPSQFLEWQEPPGNNLLLPAYLTKRELTAIIGQGGIGKSRLGGLWLPICQILGAPWCGLQTGGEPQRWLVIGSENSCARFKQDLGKILSNLSADERARVDELLRIQAVVSFEDSDLLLDNCDTREKLNATIRAHTPGAIVLDPLGNFSALDISKPHEMREAVRLVVGTVKAAAPDAAILLLHHSRTGRANILQATGWDAANFATGGKTLFAAARCVINLAPGSRDDGRRLVLSCAKANNCERFATRGLVFDEETYQYGVDPDFDVDAWQADVEGKARPGQSLMTLGDVVGAVRGGIVETKALVTHLTDVFPVSKSTVERLIRKSIEVNAIKGLMRGRYTLGPKAEKYFDATTCEN